MRGWQVIRQGAGRMAPGRAGRRCVSSVDSDAVDSRQPDVSLQAVPERDGRFSLISSEQVASTYSHGTDCRLPCGTGGSCSYSAS